MLLFLGYTILGLIPFTLKCPHFPPFSIGLKTNSYPIEISFARFEKSGQ